MNSYVALIRGINVGGKNPLPMQELTGMLEAIGCTRVRTYIQSGNVVFRSSDDAAPLTEAIAAGMLRRRGFRAHVLILDRSEFEHALACNPFPEGASDPRALHLGFLDAVPSNPDLQALEALRAASERFALIGRVFYLLAPDGVGRSRLAAKSEQALGVPMTDRNWRTVCNIRDMVQDMDR